MLTDTISKRRTFAIISHPDAGKTTLTEKLLLFGGAIAQAGEVKAKGDRRRATSDWMKVEQERGISVASSVMTFEYEGNTFNLLDTPGHEDFSEDTYRTLTAVDSAIMVLDAAKGIETQTRKLFEVCRLRNIPIITFINKMDRDAREILDILDEVEEKLALDVTPANWPIGQGRDFKGVYNLFDDTVTLVEKKATEPAMSVKGYNDPKIKELVDIGRYDEFIEGVEMAKGVCPEFDMDAYLAGTMTPVFFGSAINNFGVRELLNGVKNLAPSPRPQKTDGREIQPDEKKVSAFIFKIQANMDPKHRDRIAFARICSGKFKKGMKLKHSRSQKMIAIHSPQLFLAQDRQMVQEAFAGDIIGIPNHGNLRIGDSLTEGEDFKFSDIPSFAPEILQKARPDDPMKSKHLGEALVQLAEEGAARVFKSNLDSGWIVGVVGPLQFEVLRDRIRSEYNVPVRFEETELYTARWVTCDDAKELKTFLDKNAAAIAYDHDDDPVFIVRNAWHLTDVQDKFPNIKFMDVK